MFQSHYANRKSSTRVSFLQKMGMFSCADHFSRLSISILTRAPALFFFFRLGEHARVFKSRRLPTFYPAHATSRLCRARSPRFNKLRISVSHCSAQLRVRAYVIMRFATLARCHVAGPSRRLCPALHKMIRSRVCNFASAIVGVRVYLLGKTPLALAPGTSSITAWGFLSLKMTSRGPSFGRQVVVGCKKGSRRTACTTLQFEFTEVAGT